MADTPRNAKNPESTRNTGDTDVSRTRKGDRPYDIVLFGATGFAGELTARYLAEHAPDDCRWALAGRNTEKLKQLRERLAHLRPGLGKLPLLTADATDPASLRAIAAEARVVATTVGPYIRYGTPLVAACAEEGTDYLDLSGEPEFADLMYLRHHDRARETGARLVHACGFDSVPHDLGARFTVEQLPEGVPLRVDGYVRTNARFSEGTFASTLTAFSRFDRMTRTARERRRAEPRPEGRAVHTPLDRDRRVPEVDAWAVPLPTIDPQIIGRSAAALERYGPDFRYRHYAAVKRFPVVAGGLAAVGVAFALAQHPTTRRLLSSRLAPGEGPDEARRARSWFRVRFVGEGGGRRVVTEVSGGDPGYDETAKILAEATLCLAHDDLPATSGQVTPAAAMGGPLTERLTRAGLGFRVLREGATG
ncbi:saccharopine dehydrogenase family protein [Streptomyces daliensis]